MGWPDAKSYIDVSQGELFGNVLRPAGYPLFLRVLHEIVAEIRLVVLVNHVLGLATAVLLYLAVRRAGGPPWLGLLPAAILALGGDQVFLEHAPLSETLFTFLVALAVYAATRTLDRPGVAWPLGVGVALACAASVRVVGLALLPVVIGWLLLGSAGTLRRRLATTALAAAGAALVLGAYLAAEYRSVGEVGMSRNGGWHLYGRVAPFADCSRFEPPGTTAVLCESTARAERPITDAYIFNYWFSPAVRAYNNPFAATPEATAQVEAFARTVILNQPLNYLHEVGADMLRYVAPENLRGVGGGPSYSDLVGTKILFNPLYQYEGLESVQAHYGWRSSTFTQRPRLLARLRGYEAVTRIDGVVMVVLAFLSLAGPLWATGRARRAATLFALVAWTLLVVPVATLEFSARTAVPGFGALGAAAAVGAWVVAARLRRRSWRPGRAQPPGDRPPRAGPSPRAAADRAAR
jgi:hypothetical protein